MKRLLFPGLLAALLLSLGFPGREQKSVETSGSSLSGLPETPENLLSPFPGVTAEPLSPPVPGEAAQISLPPVPVSQEGPRFAVLPPRARPGEPVTVAYADDFSGPGSRNFQAVLMDRNGRRLTKALFFSLTPIPEGGEVKAALLAIPSTAGSGAFLVRVEAGGRIIQDLPLTAEPREFATELIPLDERNTEIRTVPDPQKTAESETLWAIISRTGTDIHDGGLFVPPVASTRRTSFFGDRRTFQYVDGSTGTSIHAGVDYGIPAGTEVRSCASGRVVLARSRIVTGNSVILEHLPGVYSLYYHLESISVKEGGLVDPGALLGLSGSTGLATGPHLHWEIRVAGENADPDTFLARAVLDKDEILRNLKP